MTASQPQSQTQLPELIEETIVGLRLRHSFYGSEVLLSNLVRSLNMCNEHVQLVRRAFCRDDQSLKTTEWRQAPWAREIVHLYALRCGQLVFNLEGNEGWDQILADHSKNSWNNNDGEYTQSTSLFQFESSEESDFPVETSDKMVGEMIESIVSIQARLQRVVLTGETQDISSSKTTTQKKM